MPCSAMLCCAALCCGTAALPCAALAALGWPAGWLRGIAAPRVPPWPPPHPASLTPRSQPRPLPPPPCRRGGGHAVHRPVVALQHPHRVRRPRAVRDHLLRALPREHLLRLLRLRPSRAVSCCAIALRCASLWLWWAAAGHRMPRRPPPGSPLLRRSSSPPAARATHCRSAALPCNCTPAHQLPHPLLHPCAGLLLLWRRRPPRQGWVLLDHRCALLGCRGLHMLGLPASWWPQAAACGPPGCPLRPCAPANAPPPACLMPDSVPI